jgi:hypothetical protein
LLTVGICSVIFPKINGTGSLHNFKDKSVSVSPTIPFWCKIQRSKPGITQGGRLSLLLDGQGATYHFNRDGMILNILVYLFAVTAANMACATNVATATMDSETRLASSRMSSSI